MSGPDLLPLLWEEHLRTPFPPHLRGRDIDGEDMVVLDSDIAGCVTSALSQHLDERRDRILVRCLGAVEKVLPLIGDDERASEYFERLREMAGLVVRRGRPE
ncbi:hypothetical protein [Saccharothrix sp. NRRL B-16314]|uniref:hypothetical protein n=1 Tax=Saccharothrix sp. NRRL B-16314 TaxID=1463825 RepID=UPI000525944A|nr:hypothetical protein [Saccharothrix sp. NRRL B-16314]